MTYMHLFKERGARFRNAGACNGTYISPRRRVFFLKKHHASVWVNITERSRCRRPAEVGNFRMYTRRRTYDPGATLPDGVLAAT